MGGRYSIRVTGNWRLTFRFEDGDVFEVDLEDYHGIQSRKRTYTPR